MASSGRHRRISSARGLVRRQPLPAVRLQLLVARCGLTGSKADEGGYHLTPLLVRKADDRRLGDGGVSEQDILDLAWVNVLAATDDHVLDPALGAPMAPLTRISTQRIEPLLALRWRRVYRI